jgi:hypothetical protein
MSSLRWPAGFEELAARLLKRGTGKLQKLVQDTRLMAEYGVNGPFKARNCRSCQRALE